MSRPPWLIALGSELILANEDKAVERSILASQMRLHVILDIGANDQHHLAASRGTAVLDSEIQEGFAIRSDFDELFRTAETASESGGHNHE